MWPEWVDRGVNDSPADLFVKVFISGLASFLGGRQVARAQGRGSGHAGRLLASASGQVAVSSGKSPCPVSMAGSVDRRRALRTYEVQRALLFWPESGDVSGQMTRRMAPSAVTRTDRSG
jgi:hypothetical protein